MNTAKNNMPPSAGRQIARLSRAAQVYFQYRFSPLGIGPAQGITLHYLSRNDGIDQMELCTRMNLDKSSLATQLKKLEEHGYIIRETDNGDRRAKSIFITPKTMKIADELHAVFTSWTELLLKDLTNVERERLFMLMNKLWTNAEAALNALRQHEKTE